MHKDNTESVLYETDDAWLELLQLNHNEISEEELYILMCKIESGDVLTIDTVLYENYIQMLMVYQAHHSEDASLPSFYDMVIKAS